MPWKASTRLKISLSIATAAREHAGPDVGDVEAFEQALHRAVLAERAVEDREGDLDVEQAAPGAQLDLLAVRGPASVALEQDLDHLVARRPQTLGNRGARVPARPRARSSGRR